MSNQMIYTCVNCGRWGTSKRGAWRRKCCIMQSVKVPMSHCEFNKGKTKVLTIHNHPVEQVDSVAEEQGLS